MHGFDDSSAPAEPLNSSQPWWRDLTSYHWFVLVVAALGWLFDTMDQQLFTLARVPAMKALLKTADGPAAPEDVGLWATVATSVFLVGWAVGGLGFGILGDRIGRAKTMLITILIYSLFTGLSAFSWDFWSFAAFRFLTGLGVGGEFAVGVALVAEVMPTRARPFALGLLQASSAIGNISAALISWVLSDMEREGTIGSAWRIMFLVGALPALLAILIRRRLKEPERWHALSGVELKKKLGSYGELFGHPTWRKNALFGMVLAFSGVVGLWGIGFFTVDLNRLVFQLPLEAEARKSGEADKDRDFVRLVASQPDLLTALPVDDLPASDQLLSITKDFKDASVLYGAMFKRVKPAAKEPNTSKLTSADLVSLVEAPKPKDEKELSKWEKDSERRLKERARRLEYLTGTADGGIPEFKDHVKRIKSRAKSIEGRLSMIAALTSIMLNLGAFFGIYAFTYITHFSGRKLAFAVSCVVAMLSTMMVFGYLNQFNQIFWMIPIMGFCQLALFGGYAIYFPELFPTYLRSTGTSFCYNVGRLVAATGPLTLGALQKYVFTAVNIKAWGLVGSDVADTSIEPMRYAGVTMSLIFLVGILVLPLLPETKGKPLPE